MRGCISGEVGLTNHLPLIVQSGSEAADAAKRAQVDHPAFFPKERILRRDILAALGWYWTGNRTSLGNTGDLATFIHSTCECIRAAQIAQVSHYAVFPKKGP